jgi:hypothetical protein
MESTLKMQSPLVYALSEKQFDLFCTWTFKNPLPYEREASTLLRRILRHTAARAHRHFEQMETVTRGEFGELNSRFHVHTIIGNLGPIAMTAAFRLELMDYWESARRNVGTLAGVQGDAARVWPYDSTLDGVKYVMKGLARYQFGDEARIYELSKFGLSDKVTLSNSLLRHVARSLRETVPSIETLEHGELGKFNGEKSASSLIGENADVCDARSQSIIGAGGRRVYGSSLLTSDAGVLS